MSLGRVLALLAVLAGLFSACRQEPDPFPPLSETMESTHFQYHFAPGDAIDTSWQELYLQGLLERLEVSVSYRLQYHKYRNRAHLKALQGRDTNGFAEPGTPDFHTIWPIDNHECVHVVAVNAIGHPPALFNEGLAVSQHYQSLVYPHLPVWNGQPVGQVAKEWKEKGQIPAVAELLESTGFFSFDPDLTYPVAGAFVHYLIAEYGIGKLKELFAPLHFESAATATADQFLLVYGLSLEAAWTVWLAGL